MKNKIRYFLISNMYPTNTYPGYGSFVKNVCDGLVDYGLVPKYKALINGKSKSKFDKLFKYIKFYVAIIYQFFKKYDFIYIHFPNQAIPVLNYLFKFKQPRIIINFHGEDLLYNQHGYGQKLGILTEKFCKKYASAIIVPSNYYKDIVERKKLIDSTKIIVSPSGGINPDYFYPNKYYKRNSLLHIGYVGRLEEDKGIVEFLETCLTLKKIRPFKATIVGYGTYTEKAYRFVQSNNLNNCINIVDGAPQQELGNYYRDLDLLIFASRRKTESLGLTGIEAMACGIPVIGSNIGGIVSYLKNGKNGWVVPINDITSIIRSINKYLDLSDNETIQLKRECIKTGKNYYSKNVCKQLAKDMYSNLNEKINDE